MLPVGLREKKGAAVRLSLLRSALHRMQTTPLDQIAVRDICEDAQMAQATFFNYFPEKNDLIVHYMQIWGISISIELRRRRQASAFERITMVFEHTVREMREHPRLMLEIISYIARAEKPPVLRTIGEEERALAFPDEPLALHAPAMTLQGIFSSLVLEAKAKGEIPELTDTDAAADGLCAIFYGVPVASRLRGLDAMRDSYLKQLELYWAGVCSWMGREKTL